MSRTSITRKEILRQFKEVVADCIPDIVNFDDMSEEWNLCETCEASKLDLVQILIGLEEKFSIALEDEDVENIDQCRVGDWVERIETILNRNNGAHAPQT
jgi:acyl carrier protein